MQLVINLGGERSTGYNSFIDTELAPTEKDGYYLYGSNFLSNFIIDDNIEANLMEGFINNIINMTIIFPILEIALYITEMINFMPYFLT